METNFIETEALLISMEDAEADSGVYLVDEFLAENFLNSELSKLSYAAQILSERCDYILRGNLNENS